MSSRRFTVDLLLRRAWSAAGDRGECTEEGETSGMAREGEGDIARDEVEDDGPTPAIEDQ
jgi:hypothetical protein